jgi:hypothetical protein
MHNREQVPTLVKIIADVTSDVTVATVICSLDVARPRIMAGG